MKLLFRTIYDYFYGKKILKNSGRLIANSKAEMRNLIDISKDYQITLVYNGIENNIKINKNNEFKKKFDIKNRYLLFLGRIDKTKGLEFIIDRFDLILSEIEYPVDLILVGPPGNFSKKLNKMITNKNMKNIKKIEFLFGNEKLSAYHEAEMFLCTPNYNSGVVLTPLESIICDTPVIVSEKIDELFKNPDIGYVVKYGDLKEFKETILKLLKDPLNL